MPEDNDHEFILDKIVALFHDPANKAEVLSYDFEGSGRGSIGHEDFACKIYNVSCLNRLYDFKSKKFKNADWLSTAIDRYMLGIITDQSSYPVEEIKLYNIIYPKFGVELGKNDRESIFNEADTFGRKLFKSLCFLICEYARNKDNKTLMLLYQALYLIYELLWIDLGYSTGPSDTRVPTHQIFDHLYSSASMINWVHLPPDACNNNSCLINLLMMGLDVVGVADFIGKGRKVRDLWASSYLVSVLIWYTLLYFINTYGPDTVIFPSLRFNQFYAFYVYEKLKKKYSADNRIEELVNKAEDLISKYIFNNDNLFKEDNLAIPPYPIIPGRATLVLPSFKIDEDQGTMAQTDPNEFEEKVQTRFNEGWKKLVETIESLARCKLNDPFWGIVFKVIKDERDILENPPLRLRVKTVIRSTQVNRDRGYIHYQDVQKMWNYYDEMYRELVNEFKKSKLVKVTPESSLRLNSTSDKYETCTSCGVLPAVISIPRSDEEKKEFLDKWGLTDEEFEDLKKIISPGERLCPVCLVKRAIGVEPRVMRTLLLDEEPEKVVNFIRSHPVSIFIPSTSHIASVDLYEKLCVKDMSIDICGNTEGISMWKKFNELKNRINLRHDPEELWFSEERRDEFAQLGLTPKSPYYALVRADSDYLGDLLEGKVTPYLAGIIDSDYYGENIEKKEVLDFLKDYYVSQVSRDNDILVEVARFLVENIRKCNLEHLASYSYSCSIKNLAKRYQRSYKSFNPQDSIEALKYFKESLEKQRIILTPAFHVSISSALNRALLYEIKLVNDLGGFVIYAGGDDLLAMLPANKVIDFLEKSRLAFAGHRDEESSQNESGLQINGNGFYKINNAYYPAMAVVGRTYSVVFSRYDDPLQFIVQLSYDLVEKMKERVHIEYNNEKRLKDLTFFYFNGDLAVIPNSYKRPIEELGETIHVLRELKRLLDEGKLSTSFLYDYIEQIELLHSMYSHGDEKVIRKYLSHLLSRHSGEEIKLDYIASKLNDKENLVTYLISKVVWDDGRTSYVIDELIKALIMLKRW